MSQQLSPKGRRVSLALLLVAVTGLVSVCDQPSEVAAPSDLTPQMAPGGPTTTLQFNVKRADNGAAVPFATISLYVNNTDVPVPCVADGVARNCWLTANASGVATLDLPSGTQVGYLARNLPQEWLGFAGQVMPPLDPGTFTELTQNNDLGALTCGRQGPIAFNKARLTQCVTNLYLTIRGTSEVVDLSLPVLNKRLISINNLQQGTSVGSAVHAYLVEPIDPLGWQPSCEVSNTPGCLPKGTKAGFLRFFGPAGSEFPGAQGFVEVYGTSPEGFDVAGTVPVGDGAGTLNVETSPVICANATQAPTSAYSLTPKPAKGDFSFKAAKWAYGAKRFDGSENALDRDLTTSVVVIEFTQKAGTTATFDISQRQRTPDATRTASVSFTCTGGTCNVNVTPSVPGGGNTLQPFLYQPKPGKVFWVVKGIDPTADSEWSAKAGGVQLPEASKSNASSAYLLFSKAFTFCDPDYSFDGGWGCGI